MSVELTKLPGVKPGSIPYYSTAGFTVPTNDPANNNLPIWLSGRLKWVSLTALFATLSTTSGDLFVIDQNGALVVLHELGTPAQGDILTPINTGGGIFVPAWTAQTNIALNGFGGTIDNTQIANRTRRIDLPLGAGVLTAGTGVAGAVITYPDAETGTRRWHCVLPADYVTGTATLYWQWTTATTTANCLWGTFIGSNTTNGAFSGTNVLNTSALYVSNGTTNLITLSSLATSSITAGQTSLQINLTRSGADVTDTINASVSLLAIWLEYTADM